MSAVHLESREIWKVLLNRRFVRGGKRKRKEKRHLPYKYIPGTRLGWSVLVAQLITCQSAGYFNYMFSLQEPFYVLQFLPCGCVYTSSLIYTWKEKVCCIFPFQLGTPPPGFQAGHKSPKGDLDVFIYGKNKSTFLKCVLPFISAVKMFGRRSMKVREKPTPSIQQSIDLSKIHFGNNFPFCPLVGPKLIRLLHTVGKTGTDTKIKSARWYLRLEPVKASRIGIHAKRTQSKVALFL